MPDSFCVETMRERVAERTSLVRDVVVRMHGETAWAECTGTLARRSGKTANHRKREVADRVDDELIAAFNRLIPLLSRNAAWRMLFESVADCDNPLALAILGEAQAAALRADPGRFEDGPFAPMLRAFLAVRSRLAEDALAEAIAAGVRQYVVLGAGLDTFAYRNPYPTLRVFEMDHPATQAWKRGRLAEAHVDVPAGVTFAAIDFATEALPGVLRAAGLRGEEPSFFSCLGVTPYLEPPTVLATLAAIAPFAANGGGVVFDYSVPAESLAPRPRAAFEAMAARAAAAGEPFRGFFEPETLSAAMQALGFHGIRDLGPDQLNARFFSERADGLRVGSAGHILTARGRGR